MRRSRESFGPSPCIHLSSRTYIWGISENDCRGFPARSQFTLHAVLRTVPSNRRQYCHSEKGWAETAEVWNPFFSKGSCLRKRVIASSPFCLAQQWPDIASANDDHNTSILLSTAVEAMAQWVIRTHGMLQ